MKELTMLAVLPGILIIIYIIKKDKVEREPLSLIIKLLVLGAVSTVAAIFMEEFITARAPVYSSGTWSYALLNAFIIAGLCEELCKFIFLLIGSWNNREFNYRFDGIVYGVAVAVGFATIENIMYVISLGFQTGLIRAVMAVPLHAFCGVFMGIFYGAAKEAQIKGTRGFVGNMILCIMVPILIHGIYDTLAFMPTSETTIALLVFVVALYIIGIRYIRKFSKEDWKNNFYEKDAFGAGGNANYYNAGTGSYERANSGNQGCGNWHGTDYSYEGNAKNNAQGSGPAYNFNLSGHGAQSSNPQNNYQPGGNPVYGNRPVNVTNGPSIAALICGILGLLSSGIFFLPSIAAVVLAIIGKSKTPYSTKNAVSTASLVLGIIGLALGAFLYYWVLCM